MSRYRVTIDLQTTASFGEVMEEVTAALEEAGKRNLRFPFWEIVGLVKMEEAEG